ncbi:MAG: hypothetical protein AB2606_02180 [Candidatus Thiodiazotropha taylori]
MWDGEANSNRARAVEMWTFGVDTVIIILITRFLDGVGVLQFYLQRFIAGSV